MKCVQIKWVSESCSVMSDSLWPHGLYSSWNSPGQNTGVGSHFLLQEIFLTQGLKPCLLHCRQILYHWATREVHPLDCSLPSSSVHGNLQDRILDWVAMASSRGFSSPRDRTCFSCSSCIAGSFFTTEPWGKPQSSLPMLSEYLLPLLKWSACSYVLSAFLLDYLSFSY